MIEFLVPKRFFDDGERIEAREFYDSMLERLTGCFLRIPIDTQDWQAIQKDFNDIRIRIETLQFLAYLVTGDSKYNKNILVQRRVTAPLTMEQMKEHVQEAREAIMRFPVENSFQRNNVQLARIYYLNRIRFEE